LVYKLEFASLGLLDRGKDLEIRTRTLLITSTALISPLCAFTAFSDHHLAPRIKGVEVFGCDFEKAKALMTSSWSSLYGTSLLIETFPKVA